MCLPNFVEFRQINENEAVIGYRVWLNQIKEEIIDLKSEHRNYTWKVKEGSHEVEESNSGIYSYNNYKNNYNYNYNNYYNNYYNYGIIKQWGKVAIHKDGYRSEYAKIITIFNIRKSDAKGSKEFLNWIDKFNNKIERIANKYECNIISYQDFVES